LDKTRLSASECYRYAMSQGIDSLVMGIRTMEQLEADAALAIPLVTMGSEEQEQLIDRAREWSGDGRCETFKSTADHEGPHHRKQHGFA
jgi:transaldolase